MSDDDDTDELKTRSPTAAASTNGRSSHPSSSSSSSMVPPLGVGGVLESMNSTLRMDLESTRQEVAQLKATMKHHAQEIAELDDADDDIVVEEELRLLQDLLAEDLSPDEDESEKVSTTKMRLDGRGQRAKTAEKGQMRRATTNTATATSNGKSSVTGTRRNVSSASASSSAALTSAASSSPWDSPPAPAAASPFSPTSANTLSRTQAVVSNYRSKQHGISQYEEGEARRNRQGDHTDHEGTVLLKANLDEQCPICLDEMVAADRVASLSCCHTFHSICILNWFTRSHACPMCKVDSFHPLVTVARRRMEQQQSDNDPSASTNHPRPSSSHRHAQSIISSSRLDAQNRPSSSGIVDSATRQRLRDLREERIRAEGRAQQVRRGENADGGGIKSSSAASRVNPSSSRMVEVGQMSLSQLLKANPRAGSAAYAQITGNHLSHDAASAATLTLAASGNARVAPSNFSRTSLVSGSPVCSSPGMKRIGSASTASSSSSYTVRPSSNSSNIRAAAAADIATSALSLTPTVTKAGSTRPTK